MEVTVKFNQLLSKGCMLLFGLLIAGLVMIPQAKVYSQNAASLPVLSLLGADNSWDANWYPDQRLRTTPSKDINNPTEILVPVFIKYGNDDKATLNKGIYTFSMHIKYDKRMFKPVGIQSFHPTMDDPKFKWDDYKTVGTSFQFQFQTYDDQTYLNWLENYDENGQNKFGSNLKIVGTSSKPLVPTMNSLGTTAIYKPFFYVRMQVLPTIDNTNLLNATSWLIIDADSIYYNDVKTIAAPNYANVSGIDDQNNPNWGRGDRCKKGSLLCVIQDKYPAFGFFMNSVATGTFNTVKTDSATGTHIEEAELVDPITVDLRRTKDELKTGTRKFQLLNSIEGTRMNQITIESDQPWLRCAVDENLSDVNFDFSYNDKYYIPYLDAKLLENTIDLQSDETYFQAQNDVWLDIDCDPTLINPVGDETEGTYVGYLTFKSADAAVNPVRLKVTFIVLRPAYEPDLYNTDVTTANHTGIRMNVTQVDNGNSVKMVFGVAPRATDGVDTLMGERAYASPLSTTALDARWMPYPNSELRATIPFGFRDALPDYDRPDYVSRDVRSIYDTTESIHYYCEFHTNTYPVKLTWNPADFPDGAILFLKDYLTDGQRFNINMREGTPVGTSSEHSYTITDADIKAFVIEYTLPKVFNFTDENGKAIIEKGWNLLSLPVRPSDPSIAAVYPNSVNKNALIFFPSGWEQTEKDMVVGQGFFIKYENVIDKSFAGSKINGIGTAYGDQVRLYNGWNLIGALTYPTSVTGITFEQRGDYPMPEVKYTKEYSYWGYRTDKGYYEVNKLIPGMGYFIKVGRYDETGNGLEAYLNVQQQNAKSIAGVEVNDKQNVYNNSTMISISDNAQKSANVYLADKSQDTKYFEMPPVLGGNFFDVRFNNNGNLSNTDKSQINLNGVAYPLSISVKNADCDLFFYDANTNELLGVIARNSGKNLELNSTVANKINVVKGSMEFQAYPNPVTSSAKVNYTVPEKSNVTLRLYNSLGNVVMEIANATMNAGSYTAEFNTDNLTSGAYMLKLNAGSYSSVTPVSVVK